MIYFTAFYYPLKIFSILMLNFVHGNTQNDISILTLFSSLNKNRHFSIKSSEDKNGFLST
ncbi:hypothetical protein HZS_6579 [Henneguya salminicola]|nr:hypothetical protein HZS_6579 [Henneguya salminicola]